MKLYQLLYSSIRNPTCNESEIQKILDSCKRNNVSQDITGVLLHSKDRFIQYLEGPKEIIHLYDLIKEDPRHSHVALLNYSFLTERVFPSWHMGYKKVDHLEFRSTANKEDKQVFESVMKGEKQATSNAVNLLVKFFNQSSFA